MTRDHDILNLKRKHSAQIILLKYLRLLISHLWWSNEKYSKELEDKKTKQMVKHVLSIEADKDINHSDKIFENQREKHLSFIKISLIL